ncbi:F-box/FBD/LRR-repeat protein At3g26920-like [Argentina anserina]|uniref:F-box/FBD/LRR-repeat protein At3g26920-like n=1 Tax=Argentina anserina TaxID=57926 RepID=UPI0021764872|nr:F-box/FBD/LRR-repeat protein At3g26920-like [Potentilla anserina]
MQHSENGVLDDENWVWQLPVFDNLKQLELVLSNCNYWEVLPEFLHSTPNLEDLVFENKTLCERRYPRSEWREPKDVPICLLSHLKTISISGFKGQWPERDLAKYLLNNGPFLDKMLIYTDCVEKRKYASFAVVN